MPKNKVSVSVKENLLGNFLEYLVQFALFIGVPLSIGLYFDYRAFILSFFMILTIGGTIILKYE